ncbi:MAG TPA: MFS transporter [Acidimicrobiales bacterium]|jgi:MFS family permease|nr:MFS transporter [Acidimicrobiales bacterium]
MAAAGFAQFSPAAALGDVAEEFGELGEGETISEQAGLPGSVLGAGLAVIRLSALLALPLAALADRVGRRRTILTYAVVGLLVTIAAAGSPGYWWFVASFAVARPFLTATDTVGEVLAAEHTGLSDRAKAIAMAAAAYGVGAGLVAILRGLAGDGLGFRPVFGLAALPLVGVAVAGRLVTEPDRFARRAVAAEARQVLPVLRAVRGAHRRRLAVLAAIGFASGFVSGPVGTLLFLYAENVLGASSAVTGALVVAAGATGLAGLMVGRLLADRVGRRPTAAVGLALMAAAGTLAYSGSMPALAVGYLCGVLFGSAYGPAAITLTAELFPTSIRAAVAGWLVVAGVLGATSGLLLAGMIADAAGSFTGAMLAVCLPGALAATLFALLPETRGLELERSAPDDIPAGA